MKDKFFKTLSQFITESENKELSNKALEELGEEFLKNYYVDSNDDNGGFGQCIIVSKQFIKWLKKEKSLYVDDFKVIQGKPKEKTDSEPAFHAVTLYEPTKTVLDLTYGQFGTEQKIKTYTEKEFRDRFPLPRTIDGKIVK